MNELQIALVVCKVLLLFMFLGFGMWYFLKLNKAHPINKKQIEFYKFMISQGKYANGQLYHRLEYGALGVIKSYPIFETDNEGVYEQHISTSPILHDIDTGECWRNNDYNIVNYPKK